MLRPATLLPALVALCCACSSTSTAPDSFTSTSSSAPMAVTARLQPGTITVTPVTGTACPVLPPFSSSFTVVVSTTSQAMTVGAVTIHFLDGTNVTSRPITFPNGLLVPAGSNVSLPFTVVFGCDIGHPRSMVADMQLVDARGATQTVTMRAETQ